MDWLIMTLIQYYIHLFDIRAVERVQATSSVMFKALPVFLFQIADALVAFCPITKCYPDRGRVHVNLWKYGFPDRMVMCHLFKLFLKATFAPNWNKANNFSTCPVACFLLSGWCHIFSFWASEAMYYTRLFLVLWVWWQCVHWVATPICVIYTEISYPVKITHKYYRRSVVKLHPPIKLILSE